MLDEGHVACAFKLGEQIAKAMAINLVRLDIFVAQGSPDGCIVNESFLSSGGQTFSHRRYMGKLWGEVFELQQFKGYGNATSKPLYLTQQGEMKP